MSVIIFFASSYYPFLNGGVDCGAGLPFDSFKYKDYKSIVVRIHRI